MNYANRTNKNDVDEMKLTPNVSASRSVSNEHFDLFSNDAKNKVKSLLSGVGDELLEPSSSLVVNSSNKSESNDVEPFLNDNVKNEFENQNASTSFCVNLTIESLDGCKRFESVPTENLETIIYRQISAQFSKMVETALFSSEIEEEMHFESENTVRSIKIVKIKSDGNCLFRALAHQLFCEKLKTRKQDLSAKKLISDVVAFIKANYEQFEHDLKGCVFER